MSQLNVDNIRNRTGSNGGPNFPSGITVAVGQTAYIHGNLQVDGTETIVNTETLNVADKTVGIGSTSNASNTTADGAGIEVFASSSQTGNNKTITWQNSSNAWTFAGGGIVATDSVVGSAVTSNASGITVTGVVTATSFKGDGSELSGIDATAIQTGNTSVQTVDTGSDGHVKMTTEGGERVRVGPAGQIGLGGANYGTSGQVITSAGSGSAPSWAAIPPGGNTFTAVASGSIANNKAVKIDTTNGKVEQVKANVTARGALNLPGSVNNVNSNEDNEYMKAVRCGDGLVMMIYQDTDNGHGAAKVAEYTQTSGNTLSFGSESTFTQSSPIDEGIDACYMGSNKVFIAWFGTGNKVNMMVGTVDPSTKAITFGSIVTTGSNTNWPAVSYDEDQDKVLLVHSTTNNTIPKGIVCSVSGTTITQGSPVSLPTIPGGGNQTTRYTTSCYDTNVNKHILGMRHETNDRCNVISATISGTSVSFGSWVTVNTNNCYADLMQIAFNTQRSAFAICYRLSNDTTVSSGTCAANGDITIHSTVGVMYHGNVSDKRNPGLVYDSVAQRLVCIHMNNTHHVKARMVIMASDYTVTVPYIETMVRGAESHDISIAEGGRPDTGGVVCIGSRWDMYGNQRGLWAVSGETTESVTNLAEARHYVGFADQAYTDGQTVTVKTYGNTANTFSGLTIGSVYYVDGSGVVSTSSGGAIAQVGMAISADTLLIKQPY